jgi:predicted metal-dependent HD superfamily phosphohydrolase
MVIDKRLVELALWYHDVVYNSRRKDNEAASADFAAKELTKLGLSGYQCAHVMRLIIATKHDSVPTAPDAMLMADIDLAILGAQPDEYARYAAAIRQEYGWLADADYRAGRTKVLQSLLDRESIYNTPKFQMEREFRARANIVQELATLQVV